MDNKLILKIDGKKVPLNNFTAHALENIIRAYIGSLKKADPDGKIEITC